MTTQPIEGLLAWVLSVPTEYIVERIAQLTADLKERTENADYLRSMVGSAHMMISRNDLGELCREEWDNTALPPRLHKFISGFIAERDAALRDKERFDSLSEIATRGLENASAKILALEAELSRLKAPVSDEEWGKGCHLANRSHVNDIIANRSKPQKEEQR